MFRRGLFYSYLSIYLKFFLGLSVTQTTLMATLPMFMNTFFQMFVWGRLSDKYQLRKTLIVIGEVIAALLTIIEWYLHYISKTKLIAGFVIIGAAAVIEIFWSMSNVGWSAMISDFYPENIRTEIQAKLASFTIASVLIPAEMRARKFAYYNATFFLSWGLAGTFFAGPTVDLLLKNGFSQNISYRISFIVAALLTFIGLIIFILFKRKLKKIREFKDIV